MNYEPRPGDYGLVSTNGIIGFLIQLGTFSKMNHAFIYEGEGIIIEATPRKGVKRSPVTDYENIVWNKNEVLTDEQRTKIVEKAADLVGRKYFFGDILVIAARILHLPVPKLILNKLPGSSHEICSGAVATAYASADIELVPGKPWYFNTPSDLLYRLLFL